MSGITIIAQIVMSLRLVGNVGISNHGRIQAIVCSLKTKTAQKMLQPAELSMRNKGSSFHSLTLLLMLFMLSALNGVSSWYF